MPIHNSGSFPERLTDCTILIVGAGAVGLATAVHLARAGHAVTVLECGPVSPPADYEKANAGPVTGHPHQGITSGRMKAFGGTTRLWGGQLVPFDQGDLETTDAHGHPLWPISYDEYRRWVDHAYDLMGVDVEGRDTAGLWARATGADPDFGEGLSPHMNIWLPEPDFTRLFAADIEGLPGLNIVTDAEVIALLFAEDGRVAGVNVRAGDGSIHTMHPREVILANGTFEISRLLLRAAATAPNCPFAENRNLGRWYLDHLHGLIGEVRDADERQLQRLFDNVYFGGRKYNVKLRLAPGASRGPANMAVTLNPRMTPREMVTETIGLARRMFRGGGFAALRQGVTMARIMAPLVWRYTVNKRSTSLFGSGTAIGVEVEQLPHFESRLLLDPSEPAETARIGIHWAFDGREMDTIADTAARVTRAFAARGLGTVEIDPRVLARDPAMFKEFHDSSHQMGGARMARSPEQGVTDPECRVFGSANLSIVGAAVFPSGSFANCTLTAIALGLRTAERVAEQVTDREGSEASAHQAPEASAQTRIRVIDRLVFGCARLTGGASERSSLALLDMAFNAGVRTVDVAPSYGMGTAEVVVGKALKRAAARGIAVQVIAKLGSTRDPKGQLKTWVRAAKRVLTPTRPRPMDNWTPQPARRAQGALTYREHDLRASFDVAMARLGRIDALMLHDAGPDDVGTEQWQALADLAGKAGAMPGYAVSWPWDAALHHAYPAPMLCENAISPALLQGTAPPPPVEGALFHSLIPTLHYLVRTDPAFAAGLDKAAALVPAADETTRRIGAFYALAAARAPQARLVYASNDPTRLKVFLDAVNAIDANDLTGPIAGCFGSAG